MKLIEYRKIAKEVEADLRAVLARHGLDLRPFGARIDERGGRVSMKLECVDKNHKDADGNQTTPEREFYKANAGYVDMKPEWLDTMFSMGGATYSVAGMKPRGAKCILIKRGDNGKVYVSTPESVAAFIKLTENKRAAS